MSQAAPRRNHDILNMWQIFDSPTDFPGQFVARRFEVDGKGEPRPTADIRAGSLESLRAMFARGGLFCITRSPEDEAQIVETWL